MTVPAGLEHVLRIDPEIMHGKLCFAGTRVPITIFLDNAADGMGGGRVPRKLPFDHEGTGSSGSGVGRPRAVTRASEELLS